MKRLLFISGILSVALFLVSSCYKDKGNYSYQVPAEPKVDNFDTVYHVLLGDSLIVAPSVTIDESKPDLSFQWEISVPEQATELRFEGPVLRMVFGLQPERYRARLTVVDNTNGMKYFYPFTISGETEFSTGMAVLSNESGGSALSFVEPDGTVKTHLYKNIEGEDLPGGARQLIPLMDQYITPLTVSSYWILGTQGSDAGVQLDPNTFHKIKSLKGNFFSAPDSARPGYLDGSPYGVLRGVINGKLYVGATQTWSQQPVYGMFGLSADGDYHLYSESVSNDIFPYFLGYDINRKQFVAFTNYGSAAYIGTGYQVAGDTAATFNPVNVGLDLIDFRQINSQNCYAFGKGANDSLYELKFGAAFMGFIQISPMYKRAFIRPDLVTPTTQWAASPAEIFYFTSGDKIYRYNPLNQDIRVLTADFNGKNVSMIRMTDNGNTLIAGAAGSIYFLDVSTGKYGDITKQIDGIPGEPVDIAIRN